MSDGFDTTIILHASSVAVAGRGLLIAGASGSGKSTLALQMIALGATLISDDRTCVARGDGALTLSAPEAIAGRIEARGFGLLTLPHEPASAVLYVDMDTPETERLPQPRETVIAGHAIPLVRRLDSPAFASILVLHLRNGPRN